MDTKAIADLFVAARTATVNIKPNALTLRGQRQVYTAESLEKLQDALASLGKAGASMLDIFANVTLSAMTKQTFSTSGTWTKGVGTKSVVVELWGGGGGGGGAQGSGNFSGSGGGSGGYVKLLLDVGSVASASVAIGAGGTAGTAGVGAGGDGGDTTFGSHATASGGKGASVSGGPGGAGGSATGGTVNLPGFPGGNSSGVARDISGSGGGPGGGVSVSAAAGSNGAPNSGAGGSGGSWSGVVDRAGGAGGSGYAVVWEFNEESISSGAGGAAAAEALSSPLCWTGSDAVRYYISPAMLPYRIEIEMALETWRRETNPDGSPMRLSFTEIFTPNQYRCIDFRLEPLVGFWGIGMYPPPLIIETQAGDVTIDSGQDWANPTFRSSYLLATLIHEVGHSLGLGENPDDPISVMNPTIAAGRINLAPADKTMIVALYGT